LAPSGSLRVLVVDDEQSVADTLALILNRSGHEAVAAYGAVEAVETAQQFRPHALVADVMMPGMSGIELARYFVENFAGCRVLLMSGMESAMEAAEKYLGDGHAVPVVSKPVLPQTILAFISSCAEPKSS
jgi:CheY-like chemotaxis protein